MTAPSQQLYRNGTVSQDSLPLWYRVSGTYKKRLILYLPLLFPMTKAADRVLRDIELGSETEGDAVCVAFSLGGNINIDQLKDCFPSRYSHNYY